MALDHSTFSLSVKRVAIAIEHPIFVTACAIVGGLYISSYVYVFLVGIYARLLRPGKNLKKSYGPWAVVTGATDGIGLAMSTEFARQGLNVLLISRTEKKLETCQKELSEKYPSVEVKILPIDFSSGGFNDDSRERIRESIKTIDVGILVNNVGISYPFTKYFHELKENEIKDLITMNVDSTTWMSKIVLEKMLPNKKGAIVNISSGKCNSQRYMPTPAFLTTMVPSCWSFKFPLTGTIWCGKELYCDV